MAKKKAEKQLSYAEMVPDNTMADDKFMTAEEKRKVLKHWENFLKNGLRSQDFTKDLYHHLTLHCSFIAHYSREGFYETYFQRGDDIALFLSQFDRSQGCRSIELGMTYWVNYPGFNDLNNALCDVAGRYIPALVKGAENKQRKEDIARAEALLARHGIKREKEE